MKQSLRRLTLIVLVACCDSTVAQTTPLPALPSPAGQDLIAESARFLFEQPALECKIRYRARSFGHELIGQGAYVQVGERERKLLRLELKVQVGDKIASLQQICGDEYLWIRRDLPPNKQELSRVTLRQYREAAGKGEGPPLASATSAWLMMGGLSRLVESQNLYFEFEAPRAGKLQSLPVWVITGHWRPERLEALGHELPLDQLPEHLPARVELTLGRDQVLPLFPYRLEWQRQVREDTRDKTAPASPPRWEPMVTMELYEVSRRVTATSAWFDYDPGDQEVADVTQAYLNKVGLPAAR